MKPLTVLHVMLPQVHAVGFAAEPSVTAHAGAEQVLCPTAPFSSTTNVQINPVPASVHDSVAQVQATPLTAEPSVIVQSGMATREHWLFDS